MTKHFEGLIARLVASGRDNNSKEVVRAGLRGLEVEDRARSTPVFPPGSLRHLYTRKAARAERRTARASALKIESE